MLILLVTNSGLTLSYPRWATTDFPTDSGRGFPLTLNKLADKRLDMWVCLVVTFLVF